jgi:hypothetical protein
MTVPGKDLSNADIVRLVGCLGFIIFAYVFGILPVHEHH